MDDKKWRFQVPGGLIGRKSLTLEEDIDFWLERQQKWFFGYATAKNGVKGTLWGKKIAFYLQVQLFAKPIDLLTHPLAGLLAQPLPDEPKPRPRLPRRLRDPKKQAYVERVEARLTALWAQFPPPVDRALEERCLAHFGNKKLLLPMTEAFQVCRDESLEAPDRCRKAASILGGMKALFADADVPAELLRDDTQVYKGLRKLLHVAKTVEEVAKQLHVNVPSDLAEMIRGLDKRIDRMDEGGNRLWNRPREMTPEEYAAHMDKAMAAKDSSSPLQKRLKLLEELWEDSLAAPEDRVEYMETAIAAVRGKRWQKPAEPCPYKKIVQRHLELLAKRLDRLEREGEAAWQRRAAREMYPTCLVWRKDSELPPLPLEEFAAGLRIASLTANTTTDETGAIHIRLEISFTDKHDSFGGHWVTANIEDDDLISVDLEG